MDENIIIAQQVIGQILSGMGIHRVISIDDFYATAESHYEDAVVLFQVARSKQDIEYSELVPKNILDAPENIWTRRLETFWSQASPDDRSAILSELVVVVGGEIVLGDVKDLSLLKEFIPKDMFAVMSPDDWDRNQKDVLAEVRNNQGVLCLFDQDLHLAGRPDNAGILLLQQTLSVCGEGCVICGLLTQTISKEAELAAARAFASEIGLTLDQFLPLSKERLRGDPMEFADGLKMSLLNYARERLSKQVRDLTKQASEEALRQTNNIDVYDFEHIVIRSSESEGIWEPDTLFRLFNLFEYDAFRRAALAPDRRAFIYSDIERMRAVRDIKTLESQQSYPSDEVYRIRQAELFDEAELLNPAHQPLDLGDIFQVDDRQYYILLAQPCDLAIRSKPMGKRSIDTTTLVRIQTYEQATEHPHEISSFRLHYFGDEPRQKAFVKFRDSFQVSLNVLDLAVFNDDGLCRFSLSDTAASNFLALHQPWRKRFEDIQRHYQTTYQEFQKIPYLNTSNYQKKALKYLLLCSDKNVDLQYDGNGIFEFGIRRVGRYRAPLSVHLLSAYFSFLSRDPQEHDFAKKE